MLNGKRENRITGKGLNFFIMMTTATLLLCSSFVFGQAPPGGNPGASPTPSPSPGMTPATQGPATTIAATPTTSGSGGGGGASGSVSGSIPIVSPSPDTMICIRFSFESSNACKSNSKLAGCVCLEWAKKF